MTDEEALYQPVEGEAVPRSLLNLVCSNLILFLLTCASIWVLAHTFQGPGIPAGNVQFRFQFSTSVICLSVMAVFVGPYTIICNIVKSCSYERLVIGADRLQIVRSRHGRDRVFVQIPYGNIARLECTKVGAVRVIGIELVNKADAETLFPRREVVFQNKGTAWHYYILNWYQKNIRDIHREISEKRRSSRCAK